MTEARNEDPNALPPGSNVGQYVIERTLGTGGFGITYLARHETLVSKLVAIKEYLPPDQAYRADRSIVRVRSEGHREDFEYGLNRFFDEANNLHELTKERHRALENIVQVQDVFRRNETAYMVMDYVEGDSLERIIKGLNRVDKIASEERIRDIFGQLARAVSFVHGRGLWHRDITPSNVIVRRKDERPVLIDFGSARAQVARTVAVTTGSSTATRIMYTPGYAPVEQCDGMEQDARTDVYGLAATMYHLVLRRKPIQSQLRRGTIENGEPDPMVPAVKAGSRDGYSRELLETIDQGLAVKPADRPKTIVDWVRPLGFDIESGAPLRPPAPHTEPDPGLAAIATALDWLRQGRRRMYVLAGAAALFLFLLIAILMPTNTSRLLNEAEALLVQAPFDETSLGPARANFLTVQLESDTGSDDHNRATAGVRVVDLLRSFMAEVGERNLIGAQESLDPMRAQTGRAGLDEAVLTQVQDRFRFESALEDVVTLLNRTSLDGGLADRGADLVAAMSPAGDDDPRAQSAGEAIAAAVAAGDDMRASRFADALEDVQRAAEVGANIGYGDVELENAEAAIKQQRQLFVYNQNKQALDGLTADAARAQTLQQTRRAFEEILRVDSGFTQAVAGLQLNSALESMLQGIDAGQVDNVEADLAGLASVAIDAGIQPPGFEAIRRAFRSRAAERRLALAGQALAAAPLALAAYEQAGGHYQSIIDAVAQFGLDASLDERARAGQSAIEVLQSARLQSSSSAYLRADQTLSDGADTLRAAVNGESIAAAAANALDASRGDDVSRRRAGVLAAVGAYRLPGSTESIRQAVTAVRAITSTESTADTAAGIADGLDAVRVHVRQGEFEQAYAQWRGVASSASSLQLAADFVTANKSWLDDQTFEAGEARLSRAYDSLVEAPLNIETLAATRTALTQVQSLSRLAGRENSQAAVLSEVLRKLPDVQQAMDAADFIAARDRIAAVVTTVAGAGLSGPDLQSSLDARLASVQGDVTSDVNRRVREALNSGFERLRRQPLDTERIQQLNTQLAGFTSVRGNFQDQGIVYDWSGVDDAAAVCAGLTAAMSRARDDTDYVAATRALVEVDLALSESSRWKQIVNKASAELNAEYQQRITTYLGEARGALRRRPMSAETLREARDHYSALRRLERSSDGQGAQGEAFVDALRPHWQAWTAPNVSFLLDPSKSLKVDTESYFELPGARATVEYLDGEISTKVSAILADSRKDVDELLSNLGETPDRDELNRVAMALAGMERRFRTDGLIAPAEFAASTKALLDLLIQAHGLHDTRFHWTALERLSAFNASQTLASLQRVARNRLVASAEGLEQEIRAVAFRDYARLNLALDTAFRALAANPLDQNAWSGINSTVAGILRDQPDFPNARLAQKISQAVSSSVGGQAIDSGACSSVGSALDEKNSSSALFSTEALEALYQSSCG